MKTALSAMSMAVLMAVTGGASASSTTLTTGSQITVSDPLGSGRSTELTLLSASGTLAFSNGGFDGVDFDTLGGFVGDVLNFNSIAVTPVAPAWIDALPAETRLDGVRISSGVTVPVTGVSIGAVDGAMEVVGSAGGVQLEGWVRSPNITGGYAWLNNLRFDLANGQVVADLTGVRFPQGSYGALQYNLPDTVLWTFDKTTVTGPAAFKPEDLLAADPVAAMMAAGYQVQVQDGQVQYVAEHVITGLKITTTGATFLRNSLGLRGAGLIMLAHVNADIRDPDSGAIIAEGGYGTVTTRLVFSAGAVPEPSTYALMGLGLVGLALAVRRHARAKSPALI